MIFHIFFHNPFYQQKQAFESFLCTGASAGSIEGEPIMIIKQPQESEQHVFHITKYMGR